MMDNQATKHIKQFLMSEECKLQLVEPHNHHVNAKERVIQTFKDSFISTLATTDCNFTLQLWDKLTPQVINTLNMMQASQIDPSRLAYKTLYGPYDWNRYPPASLGCKAVVYENGDTRGSWASRGVDGWYLGLLMDHYCCNVYYIPETHGYCVSGSLELFPQHCQLPDMMPYQHLHAITNKLHEDAGQASTTRKRKQILPLLHDCITAFLAPLPTTEEQRVSKNTLRAAREDEQRVIDASPIITIPRITDAPSIINARNPDGKAEFESHTLHTPTSYT